MGRTACILAVTLVWLVSSSFGQKTKHPPPESNAAYLGTGGGASFYTEPTNRDWYEANDYCTQYGMMLAWIKTPEQELFLTSIKDNPNFNKTIYWTSATDLTSSQDRFGWFGVLKVTRLHILFPRQEYPIHMCLGLWTSSPLSYYAALCSNKFPTLCQIDQ